MWLTNVSVMNATYVSGANAMALANTSGSVSVFAKYDGVLCSETPMLRGFQGTVEQCKEHCDQLGIHCSGFSQIRTTELVAGSCHFETWMQNTTNAFLKVHGNGDCYVKQTQMTSAPTEDAIPAPLFTGEWRAVLVVLAAAVMCCCAGVSLRLWCKHARSSNSAYANEQLYLNPQKYGRDLLDAILTSQSEHNRK